MDNILRPQEGFQEKFLSSESDIVIAGGAAGSGKSLSLDSQVLMADGNFDSINNVRVGDCIVGDDGKETMIIDVVRHSDLKFYRLEFTDNTYVDACEDHLWRVKKKGNDEYEVLDTKSIEEDGVKSDGCYQYEVPLVEPIELFKQDLPLDPYLLGVFLGDGHFTKNGTVSLAVGFEELEGLKKYLPRWNTLYDKGTCFKVVFKQFKDIIKSMGLNGMVRDDKFIPRDYLISSIEDRLELLRGLMDTDGTVSTRLSGNTNVSFCNQNKNLIDGVVELVRSLGGVASVYHYVNKNSNRNEYYVNIRMTLNPFKLDRKANTWKPATVKKKIRKIYKIDNQPGICIGVTNPNRCFVTNDYTVTHNSFALILELARLIEVENGTGVVFRRTSPELRAGGGLWDIASQMYSPIATINNTKLELVFPSNCKIKFSHLQKESDVYSHQGSQYAFIGFDEVQHFSWNQFRYLLSRNRTMSNIRPYIRCTCNPEAGIWLRDFIDWWIGVDGFPINERDGVLRYMYMKGDKVKDIVWGSTKEEVIEKLDGVIEEIADKFKVNPKDLIKSVTFIAGSLEDNQKLLKNDPSYIANLLAQDDAEQAKLLYGNCNEFSDDSQRLFSNTDNIFQDSSSIDPNGLWSISVDPARQGKDLAVVMLWKGFEVISMSIFTKCTTEDIYNAVENYRSAFNVSRSKVIVDSDGVGGGVVDRGRYLGLNNGGRALDSINETTNFSNLKSQLYYLAARVINNHTDTGFRINTNEIYVDGVKTKKINNELISDRILEELMSFTRDYTLGKKRINSKDDIKKKINRSPDFADSIAYNFYLYLNRRIFGLHNKVK